MIRCGYSQGPDGQVHWRECGGGAGPERPLLCLHPAPFSGLFFTSVMPLLAGGNRVIAPDYPGYGGSSAPASEPAIGDYARAMLALADELAPRTPLAVLGFHTGCLVAAEMALQAPTRLRQLILVDVPYFTGERQAQMLAAAAQPLDLGADTGPVEALWQKGVAAKLEAMAAERAVALLAEQLRVARRAHWAFRAAFTYPCEQSMAGLTTPAHVIATRSGLLEATRECASAIPGSVLEERLDITRAVFEEGAASIARSINTVLESAGHE